MLCPNCGTEVGDELGLCSRCASSGAVSGAAIGAIRPALKVVHLKPGQTAADFTRPTLGEGFPAGEEAAPVRRVRENRSGGALITGVILIFGALVALAYLLLFSSGDKSLSFKSEPKQQQADFSHIVIHEKKEVTVDGVSTFGVYRVDERDTALGKPHAYFDKVKNTLAIHYPAAEVSARENIEPPLLKVWLQFSKLGTKIDRDKLQSYMIEFSGEKEPQRIVRTYSRHLADFAEVSLLSNGIRVGDNIRGSMQSAQTVDAGPTNVDVSWQLTFDAPLEAPK